MGWLTPVLPLLKSEDTPLTSGPLSLEDVSWMASIAPIGSVFSALIFRWITIRIGSKRMMTNCLAIVSVVSFLPMALSVRKTIFKYFYSNSDLLVASRLRPNEIRNLCFTIYVRFHRNGYRFGADFICQRNS